MNFMNISEQYKILVDRITENLPLKAYPNRDLVKIFRNDGHPITLQTELSIIEILNSGDISGIMCIVKLADGYKMACALTFLIFTKQEALYTEIVDYQRKREKRVKQLRMMGGIMH